VTFNEVLSQTIAMLRQHGRVSYRALKRQFALDDTFLEDLTYELIAVQQCAVDQDGTVLVWAGDVRAAATPLSAPAPSAPVPLLATRPEPTPLQARPDTRSSLRGSAPGATARAPHPHRGGPRTP
jgi:hypothetical protein